MDKKNKSYFVERTCTELVPDSQERISRSLKVYREQSAYVLLGDPGAGKTIAFKQEAEESGGEYIKARDFAVFGSDAQDQEKILFIDALDEMRIGADSRTPLDQIRKHLVQIGNPRFRLSCREADWLGDSDREALTKVSPDQKVVVLHLDPLTDEKIAEILRHKTDIAADEFVEEANHYGLGDLLRNPQTLNLLIEAVGDKAWPQSRKEVYEMACRKLGRESNPEHRLAKRDHPISDDTLLDAAGFLCAIQLLSGAAGFALDDGVMSEQHIDLKNLADPFNSPVIETLKTKLFQGDGDYRRVPIHRSVAEYLGARHIAKCIENQHLPIGRVLALMTGDDGGIVTDLRGLSAWLSVHCLTARARLIESDPLGVVLYGDVKHFPPEDKKSILESMHGEAIRYPWFRVGDWSSPPFGALGTIDMEPVFRKVLGSTSRDDADQSLLDCILDAMLYGERMPMLADALNTIARDVSYWPTLRAHALRVLLHVTSNDHSYALSFIEEVKTGVIEDREDELLGILLSKLYPETISVEKVLDYLHPRKARNLFGAYFMFWTHELVVATPLTSLPILLDQLVLNWGSIEPLLYEQQLGQMAGELLVRGLKIHGDTVTGERLYDWLGVGLDQFAHSQLKLTDAKSIAQWFEENPDRYKAILNRGAALYINGDSVHRHMYGCTARLYNAIPPDDIVFWCLTRAAEQPQIELAQYYFVEAVSRLRQQDGDQYYLTGQSLEFLGPWIEAHPHFRQWLEPFIVCPINESQQEHAISNRNWELEWEKRKIAWVSFFREHLSAIRNASAPPKILHDLALAYQGLLYEARGNTPQERLTNFLGGDNELISAAFEGFRQVLYRRDLPTVEEIIDLELQGQMHLIRWPCLVGIDVFYHVDPLQALRLDDAILLRLIAFRLTDNTGTNLPWFTALLQKRPALLADVLVAYVSAMLRAKKEHVGSLYALAYDDTYASVARIVLPSLLEGFPLRAGKNQLSNALDALIKGALRYLESSVLAQIVARKLALKSVDAAQRVYWLACGLLTTPEIYEAKLMQYLGKNQVRRNYLSTFFISHERRIPKFTNLPETTLALLIELLAPDCSSERPMGTHSVTPVMETAELVRTMICTLESSTSALAKLELERLLALPTLSNWYTVLQGALHSQRIARRKASFNQLGSAEVSRTLANLQPASAADLAALVFDHLSDIAKNIRDGNTNDYRQYWSHDAGNKELSKSKPENDCRDALLSDLKIHLGKLNIEAVKEGHYVEDKRADIRVSFGGVNGFNVPIEIKKDNHANLWTAIHKQLVAQYVRDPDTGGNAIYLVFWFGGKGMPQQPSGKKPPRSAKELEDQLRSILAPEEKHCIKICVIDCALPPQQLFFISKH